MHKNPRISYPSTWQHKWMRESSRASDSKTKISVYERGEKCSIPSDLLLISIVQRNKTITQTIVTTQIYINCHDYCGLVIKNWSTSSSGNIWQPRKAFFLHKLEYFTNYTSSLTPEYLDCYLNFEKKNKFEIFEITSHDDFSESESGWIWTR